MEDGSVGMQKLLRDYQVFQRRLEEAKYNRDVDSQRHFEKILKSIKEQLHHNHLSHSTKPPTPPSNEIKPIVRSAQSTGPQQQASIPSPPPLQHLSFRQSVSLENQRNPHLQQPAVPHSQPPIVAPQSARNYPSNSSAPAPAAVSVLTFPKELVVMNHKRIEKLKEEFSHLWHQINFNNNGNIETILEALTLHLQHEISKDISHETLLNNEDATKCLDELQRLFKSVELLQSDVIQELNQLQSKLDEFDHAKSKYFEDSVPICSHLREVASTSRLFSHLIPILDILLTFYRDHRLPSVETTLFEQYDAMKRFLNENMMGRDVTAGNDVVKSILQFCDSWVKFTRTRQELLLDCLRLTQSLLKRVRCVDIQKVIDKMMQSKSLIQSFANKLAVFFIGNQGAGKTTLMNVVLGQPLTSLRQSNNHGLISSDNVQLTPVAITTKDGKQIIVVDTPALVGQADIVEQIVTICQIVLAMQQCQRVKIVLCLAEHHVVENLNSSLFQELCDCLYGIVTDPNERYNLIYALGNCQLHDQAVLANRILNRSLSLPRDTSKKNLVIDLANKLSHSHGAYIVKVGDLQCRKTLLRVLCDFDELTFVHPMSTFKVIFPTSITESLNHQFRMSLYNLEKSIEKNEMQTVTTIFSQFFLFATITKNKEIRQVFAQAIQELHKLLSKSHETLHQLCENAFHFPDFYPLDENSIVKHLQCILLFNNVYKEEATKLDSLGLSNRDSRNFVMDVRKLMVMRLAHARSQVCLQPNALYSDYTVVGRLLANMFQVCFIVNELITEDGIQLFRTTFRNEFDQVIHCAIASYRWLIEEFKNQIQQLCLVEALTCAKQIYALISQVHQYCSLPRIEIIPGLNDIGYSAAAMMSTTSTMSVPQYCQYTSQVLATFLYQSIQTLLDTWQPPIALQANVAHYHRLLTSVATLLNGQQHQQTKKILQELAWNESKLLELQMAAVELGVKTLDEIQTKALQCLEPPHQVDTISAFHTFHRQFQELSNHSLLETDSKTKRDTIESALKAFILTSNKIVTDKNDSLFFNSAISSQSNANDIEQVNLSIVHLYRAASVYTNREIVLWLEECKVKIGTYLDTVQSRLRTANNTMIDPHNWELDKIQDLLTMKCYDWKLPAIESDFRWKHIAVLMKDTLEGSVFKVDPNLDLASIEIKDKIRFLHALCSLMITAMESKILQIVQDADNVYGKIFETMRSSNNMILFMKHRGDISTDIDTCRIITLLSSLQTNKDPLPAVERIGNNVRKQLPEHYQLIEKILCDRYGWMNEYVTRQDVNLLNTADNFVELANALEHLQTMSAMHPDIANPTLDQWYQHLKHFHDDVRGRVSSLDMNQSSRLANICYNLGNTVDTLIVDKTVSFKVVGTALLAGKQDTLKELIVAMEDKDYVQVTRLFKMLGWDNVHSIDGFPPKETTLIESLRMTLLNDLSFCLNRFKHISLHKDEEALKVIWNDVVTLATAEMFLPSLLLGKAFNEGMSNIIAAIQGWMSSFDQMESNAKIALKQDAVDAILLIDSLHRQLQGHNCFDLPHNRYCSTKTDCGFCCKFHSTPVKTESAKDIDAHSNRYFANEVLRVFRHGQTILNKLETHLIKQLNLWRKHSELLRNHPSAKEFIAHLPEIVMIGANSDVDMTLLDSNQTTGTATATNGSLAVQYLQQLSSIISQIDHEIDYMMECVKQVDSDDDNIDLKSISSTINILIQSSSKFPAFPWNNLQRKYEKPIRQYFAKVKEAKEMAKIAYGVDDDDDDDEDDADFEEIEGHGIDDNRSISTKATAVSQKKAVQASQDKAKKLMDGLSSINVWDRMKTIQSDAEFLLKTNWGPSKNCDMVKSKIQTVIDDAHKYITACAQQAKNGSQETDEFLDFIRSKFSDIQLIVHAVSQLLDLQPRYSNVFDKLVPVASMETLVDKLIKFLGDLSERLSEALSDGKALHDMVSASTSHQHALITDVSKMKSQCQSFKVLIDFKGLFQAFTELMKTNIGQRVKSSSYNVETVEASMRESILQAIKALKGMEFYNDTTRNINSQDREQFYQLVFARYILIHETKWLHNESMDTIVAVMKTGVQVWYDRGKSAIRTHLNQIDLKEFDLACSNLQLIARILEPCKSIAEEHFRMLDNEIAEKIQTIANQWTMYAFVESEQSIEQVNNVLIMLYQFGNKVSTFQERITKAIESIVNHIWNQGRGGKTIGTMAINLDKSRDGTGQQIISTFGAFKGYEMSLRNTRFTTLPLSEMMSKLDGDDLDRSKLEAYYTAFDQEYWKVVKAGLATRSSIGQIPQKTVDFVRKQSNKRDWNVVLKILANVCGYWTLMDPSYCDSSGGDTKYLLQPHRGQIIAFLRLFGFDAKSVNEDESFSWEWFGNTAASRLSNHLVQVRTGEGKSVILGVMSTTLALMGFDVDCVCYSKHLSDRDFKEFEQLFVAFQVLQHIKYGTFIELCEGMLNRGGDIRSLMSQAILDNVPTGAGTATIGATASTAIGNQMNGRPKLLLIDEVDVFFQRGFYGSMYNLLAPISAADVGQVNDLVNKVWSFKSSNEDENKLRSQVLRSEEYKACCARFSNWSFIVSEAVKEMVKALKTYDTGGSKYEVDISEDPANVNKKTLRVGYLNNDNTVSYNKVDGYNTMFIYMKEFAKHHIHDDAALRKHMNLLVTVASFSYAEFPKYYCGTLGVSGTLRTLSDETRKILKDSYRMNKFTYLPSAYGREMDWEKNDSDNILLVEVSEFYTKLVQEIRLRRREGNANGIQRPVLVFFNSYEEIELFLNCKDFQLYREQTLKLYTGMKEEYINENIQKAMEKGAITLLTREFGRGTNFYCKSEEINVLGGIHVIATFISLDVAEEIQIIGRTGRQGNKGSFSMVLTHSACEQVGVTHADITKMLSEGKRYDLIHNKRLLAYKNDFEEQVKYIEMLAQMHGKSADFVDHLRAGDFLFVHQFLSGNVVNSAGGIQSRTIILMDATGSMYGVLKQTKQTICKMIDRVCEILKEKNHDSSFEIQFVAYRNYNSDPTMILEVSPWESTALKLLDFISKIEVDGGWGNEAIEVALHHVNEEHDKTPVTQIIIIGDAAPNTRSDIPLKRNPNKTVWDNHERFKTPTYYEEELTKISEQKIKINAFYIDDDPSMRSQDHPKPSFEKMANTTDGKAMQLVVNSPNAADTLTGVVSLSILNDIGTSVGGGAANDLINAYKEKFGFQGFL